MNTTATDALGEALIAAGFIHDEATESYLNDLSQSLGMHDNGRYAVLGHYTKDGVSVTIERTESPEASDDDDSDVMWLRPPVAIIEGGPTGRMCANPADVPLVLALAGQASSHTL